MNAFRTELEDELVNKRNRVLAVVGAGVSIATDPNNPCASWRGLIEHGLKWCEARCPSLKKKKLSAYRSLLDEGELIDVAKFIVDSLREGREGDFDAWLKNAIGALKPKKPDVINGLTSWNVQIATTNFDTLVEQVTGKGSITWREPALVSDFLRGNDTDVLHIHGHYRRPDSIVFDIRTYFEILENRPIQEALRALLQTKTLVFIGCGAGLQDLNFEQLLKWCGVVLAHADFSHYLLVPASQVQSADSQFKKYGVRAVPYGEGHAALGPFLAEIGGRVNERRSNPSDLELLLKRQADFGAQAADLESRRGTLEPGDYLRRRMELAQVLARVGGRRVAAFDMSSVYRTESGRLTLDERVRIGVDVAEMLLDDGLERMAADILEPLLRQVDGAEMSTDLAKRFHAIRVRCLNDLCAYGDILGAIERAIPLADSAERERLEAQRVELHLLQGELERATECAADGGRS